MEHEQKPEGLARFADLPSMAYTQDWRVPFRGPAGLARFFDRSMAYTQDLPSEAAHTNGNIAEQISLSEQSCSGSKKVNVHNRS